MTYIQSRDRLGKFPSYVLNYRYKDQAIRAVISYPYHRRGSTVHCKRGDSQFRWALPEEGTGPLGPRLAENDHKTVWIEVSVEAEPDDDLPDIADSHESEADAIFQTHRPGHLILD